MTGILAALIGAASALQVSGLQITAVGSQSRKEFVRSQQQVVYSTFLTDEQTLAQLESDFLTVEHQKDTPDGNQLTVRGRKFNQGEQVTYGNVFLSDQLDQMQDQARKIVEASRKLDSDYSALVLVGSRDAADLAEKLRAWHIGARAHFDVVSTAQSADRYLIAGPETSDGGYGSSNFAYDPEQEAAKGARIDFTSACRKDLGIDVPGI